METNNEKEKYARPTVGFVFNIDNRWALAHLIVDKIFKKELKVKVEEYYCDRCGNLINYEDKELNILDLHGCVTAINVHLCPNCAQEVLNLINDKFKEEK